MKFRIKRPCNTEYSCFHIKVLSYKRIKHKDTKTYLVKSLCAFGSTIVHHIVSVHCSSYKKKCNLHFMSCKGHINLII